MNPKIQKRFLTVAEKQKFLKEYDKGCYSHLRKFEISQVLGITTKSLHRILLNRTKIENLRIAPGKKFTRARPYPEHDSLVFKYIQDCLVNQTSLTVQMICKQAEKIAKDLKIEGFRGSSTWYRSYRKLKKLDRDKDGKIYIREDSEESDEDSDNMPDEQEINQKLLAAREIAASKQMEQTDEVYFNPSDYPDFEALMKSYVESLKGRTRLSRGMICKEALKTAEALKIDGLEPNLYRWYNKFVKDMNLRWDNIQKCLIECEEKEKSKSISLSQVDLMENNQQIFKEENGIEVPSMSIENMDVFEPNIQIKEEPEEDIFVNVQQEPNPKKSSKSLNQPHSIKTTIIRQTGKIVKVGNSSKISGNTSSIHLELSQLRVKYTNLEKLVNSLSRRMNTLESQNQQLHQRLQRYEKNEEI